jgi:hypothetical protein
LAPGNAVLPAVLTSAVTATSLPGRPAEGSSLLLNTRLIAAACSAGSGVAGGVDDGGCKVPPQPDRLVSEQVVVDWASPPPPQAVRKTAASSMQAL